MNAIKLPYSTEEDESVLVNINVLKYKQVWHKIGSSRTVIHRLRGPAVIYRDGSEFWFREGAPYTPTAHELMLWELRKKNECY